MRAGRPGREAGQGGRAGLHAVRSQALESQEICGSKKLKVDSW